jgi:NAD(P)-dependent dehydrogenase (short-subunit alcohol dehydrogenase family)
MCRPQSEKNGARLSRRVMSTHGRDVRTALVTGANRGLGLETSRQLLEDGFQVLLTSRRKDEGVAAARMLDPTGGNVVYHALDVTDSKSIGALANDLPAIAPRLDMLVNNAGIGTEGSDLESARQTLAVNYFGPRDVTDALLPFLRKESRIVMVSSGMGELSYLGRELRARFVDPALTRAGLDALVAAYLSDVAGGHARRAGWPTPYSVSKVSLNALTRILARELSPRAISVNAVCPGWVRTDMGGRRAPRSLPVGARSIVLGAKLPADATGGFYRDGRRIPW